MKDKDHSHSSTGHSHHSMGTTMILFLLLTFFMETSSDGSSGESPEAEFTCRRIVGNLGGNKLKCTQNITKIGNVNMTCTMRSEREFTPCNITCLDEEVKCGYFNKTNAQKFCGPVNSSLCGEMPTVTGQAQEVDILPFGTDSPTPTVTGQAHEEDISPLGTDSPTEKKQNCPVPSTGHLQSCHELNENISSLSECKNERALIKPFRPVAEHLQCTCSALPEILGTQIQRCLRSILSTSPPTRTDLEDENGAFGMGHPGADNGVYILWAEAYKGPVTHMLNLTAFVSILPLTRLANISIEDLDGIQENVYAKLPDPQKLLTTRNSLEGFDESGRQEAIQRYIQKDACAFMRGASVEVVSERNMVSAQDARSIFSTCSGQDTAIPPARAEALCDIIQNSTSHFNDFKDLIQNDRLNPFCLIHILNENHFWREVVFRQDDFAKKVCMRIGTSFSTDVDSLRNFAGLCERYSVQTNNEYCSSVFPSMVPWFKDSAGFTFKQLKLCTAVLCSELCTLPPQLIAIIKESIKSRTLPELKELRCLAYIVKQEQYPQINGMNDIRGSCVEKSKLLKRYLDHTSSRKKRQAESQCDVFCSQVSSYQQNEVSITSVLDANTLSETPCIAFSCIEDQNLGHLQWNEEQALALLSKIRESRTLDSLDGNTLAILGYVSLGLTPEELRDLEGITNSVFSVYGAVHGWHPDQLNVLAERYLKDNNKEPSTLDVGDIGVLGHLICGFNSSQIDEIPSDVIRDTTQLLGHIRQCNNDVLNALATHLRNNHGEVKSWMEEQFNEFGILNAGLTGEEIASTGRRIVDHLNIPFINHIPPYEFAKMTVEQLELFTIEQAIAVERIGLCPFLGNELKRRNLAVVCASTVTGGAQTTSRGGKWIQLLLALSTTTITIGPIYYSLNIFYILQ